MWEPDIVLRHICHSFFVICFCFWWCDMFINVLYNEKTNQDSLYREIHICVIVLLVPRSWGLVIKICIFLWLCFCNHAHVYANRKNRAFAIPKRAFTFSVLEERHTEIRCPATYWICSALNPSDRSRSRTRTDKNTLMKLEINES